LYRHSATAPLQLKEQELGLAADGALAAHLVMQPHRRQPELSGCFGITQTEPVDALTQFISRHV
jgi:hypothetical protein